MAKTATQQKSFDIQKVIDICFLQKLQSLPITMRGFHSAKECVAIYLREKHLNDVEIPSAIDMYSEIEYKFKLNKGTVEKRIRDFVKASWHLFPKLFEARPTNYEFIARIAEVIDDLINRQDFETMLAR
ncbi:MAG: sporulation initiation factor Spo0A C-terminal domain-containing protein [Firmicutes bacterium]|nr:sporulation initiation factor Spo0A C-terminal domain-containing protein [Bacillota bacterium]